MIRIARRTLMASWMATVMIAPMTVAAQAQDEPEMVVKVYAVADLVFVAPDYPYEGPAASVPRARPRYSPSFGGGGKFSVVDTLAQFGGRGAGGGRGGGGGAGRGGMVSPAATDSIARFDMDALIEVITSTIEPVSWDEVGGSGSIKELGSQLIVMQTAAVHEKLEQLFEALRKEGPRETVTVRAHWLLLDNVKYAELTAGNGAASPPRINREGLQSLEGDATTVHGEVTCSDGQTVHITSGRIRSAVTSIIPVVGQVEQEPDGIELAMVDASENVLTGAPKIPQVVPSLLAGGQVPSQALADRSVGYQPVTTVQNSGVVLELTPTRLPGAKAVVLDLKSVATRWNEPDEALRDFRGVIKLDRTDVIAQKLATTLRVPVGVPVLVGGLTLEPGATEGEPGNLRLYLVVEVTVGEK